MQNQNNKQFDQKYLKDYHHIWHQYTVRVNHGRDRDAVVQQLARAGVGSGVYYPVPIHHQAHIREVVGQIRLPVAEKMAGEVLSLPIHPKLEMEDLETIVKEVNRL